MKEEPVAYGTKTGNAMTAHSAIPTPETDANLCYLDSQSSNDKTVYVDAELSRSLERRLQIALAALNRIKKFDPYEPAGPATLDAEQAIEEIKSIAQ